MDSPWSATNKIPLMSEDSDWYAFPAILTRREVMRELLYNYLDWMMDEMLRATDDDRCVVSLEGYRSLFNEVKPGYLRPSKPDEYGFADDWWYETDDNQGVPAWIVKL